MYHDDLLDFVNEDSEISTVCNQFDHPKSDWKEKMFKKEENENIGL